MFQAFTKDKTYREYKCSLPWPDAWVTTFVQMLAMENRCPCIRKNQYRDLCHIIVQLVTNDFVCEVCHFQRRREFRNFLLLTTSYCLVIESASVLRCTEAQISSSAIYSKAESKLKSPSVSRSNSEDHILAIYMTVSSQELAIPT